MADEAARSGMLSVVLRHAFGLRPQGQGNRVQDLPAIVAELRSEGVPFAEGLTKTRRGDQIVDETRTLLYQRWFGRRPGPRLSEAVRLDPLTARLVELRLSDPSSTVGSIGEAVGWGQRTVRRHLNDAVLELSAALARESANRAGPELPTLAQLDLTEFRFGADFLDGQVPHYMRRTADVETDTALAEAVALQHRALILEGPPKAGKTRALVAALSRSGLDDAPVLVVRPPAPAGESPLANVTAVSLRNHHPTLPTVVLVDDLHLHLLHGVEWSSTVKRLTQEGGVLVVGTLSTLRMRAGDTHGRWNEVTEFDLRESSLVVDYAATFDEHEQLALVERYSDRLDRNLSFDDVRHFPEFCSSVPQLLARHRGAVDAGGDRAALALAAADAYLIGGADLDWLRAHAQRWLRRVAPTRPVMDAMRWATALDWATQPLASAYALLLPAAGGRWSMPEALGEHILGGTPLSARYHEPHSELLDHVEPSDCAARVDRIYLSFRLNGMWPQLSRVADLYEADGRRVAAWRLRYQVAARARNELAAREAFETYLQELASEGDTTGHWNRRAIFEWDLGNFEAAFAMFWLDVEEGNWLGFRNVVEWLLDYREGDNALEQALETWPFRDDRLPSHRAVLGALHARAGDPEVARQLLADAFEAGVVVAGVALARLERMTGNFEAAAAWAKRVAEQDARFAEAALDPSPLDD